MQTKIINLPQLEKAHWQDLEKIHFMPETLKSWLTDPGSMTARLKQHCRDFNIEVLQQEWQVSFIKEAEILSIQPQELCLIREVIIYCDGIATIFGRTVMPKALFQDQYKDLQNLDATPIGEILFSDPSTRRSAFEYAKIEIAGNILYARRSVFYLSNQPLLLTEIFLENMTSQFLEDK